MNFQEMLEYLNFLQDSISKINELADQPIYTDFISKIEFGIINDYMLKIDFCVSTSNRVSLDTTLIVDGFDNSQTKTTFTMRMAEGKEFVFKGAETVALSVMGVEERTALKIAFKLMADIIDLMEG